MYIMCPVPWLKTYCLLHKSEKLSISNLEPSSSCVTALIDWTLSTTLGPRELSIRRLRPLRSVRADGRPRPGIRKMEDSSEQCFLLCCTRRSTCWRHAVNQNWEPQYPDEQASCHVSNHGCRTSVNQRQVKCKEAIREREREEKKVVTALKPISPSPPSPIQDATPYGQGFTRSFQCLQLGVTCFACTRTKSLSTKRHLKGQSTDEESTLQMRIRRCCQFHMLESTAHSEMTSMAQKLRLNGCQKGKWRSYVQDWGAGLNYFWRDGTPFGSTVSSTSIWVQWTNGSSEHNHASYWI